MKIHYTLKTSFCLLVGAALVAPLHAAEKELKSAAVTVGDLGNPFFVQIARGAETKAKEINPKRKIHRSVEQLRRKQSNQPDG